MLRRLKIGTRVNVLIAVPLLALLALTWVSYLSLERASVRGDQYRQLKSAEALRNDIVPPPANLITAWVAVNHLSVLVSSPKSDRTDREIGATLQELQAARVDYNTALAHWRAQPLDPDTKSVFESAAGAGTAFFAKVDNALTPTMVSRDPANVIEAVRTLGDDFQVQQVFITRLLTMVDGQVAAKEAGTDTFVSRVLVLLAGAIGTLLLICLVVAYFVRRSIVKPILALSSQAKRVAEVDLPTAVHQIQSMPAGGVVPAIAPFSTGTDDELADLGASFNSVQNAALDLASEQAQARRVVADNLVNIARRTQTLLGRSLTALSDMEQSERDPQVLERLFHLDHLSTRMRRNAQSLLVLAGADQNRLWCARVPIGDVVRAAVSEIEHYDRVDLGDLGVSGVQGALAPEIAHLFAELLENATLFSPPSSKVMVVGRNFPDGHQIAVIDYGIGMAADEIDRANASLRRHVDFATTSSKMLGFQVVARIAAKHGVEVVLAHTAGATGVTAIVKLPLAVLDNRESPHPEPVLMLGAQPTAEFEPERAPESVYATAFAPVSSAPTTSEPVRPSAAVFTPRLLPPPSPSSAGATLPAPVGLSPTGAVAVVVPSPPVIEPGPVDAELWAMADITPNLPKRVRGAQLPDLGAGGEPDPPFERSAEQVRNTLADLQRGVELGRQNVPE